MWLLQTEQRVWTFARRPWNPAAQWELARQGPRGADHLGPAQLLGSDWNVEHEMVQLRACFPESEPGLKPGTDWDGAHISQWGRMGRLRSTRLVLIQL